MCPRAQNHIFCWVHHCTFIFSPDFLRTEFGSEIQIRMTRIELYCILSHTLTYPRARSVNSGRRFLGPEVKFSLQAWKLNNCLQCRELCGNICKMKSHDHLRYTVANYVDLNISRCRRVVRKTSRWRSTTFSSYYSAPGPHLKEGLKPYTRCSGLVTIHYHYETTYPVVFMIMEWRLSLPWWC